MTVFYVTVNQPGYSPESDPIGCETLADARECVESEIMCTDETVGSWDGRAFARSEALEAAATLKAGESILFAGYVHSITESAEAR